MLYFVVGLWVATCLTIYGLEKLGDKKLNFSCPCIAVGTIMVSLLLFLSHHPFIASVVLVVGIALFILFVREMMKRRHQGEHIG